MITADETAVREWRQVPVDDVGYLDSGELRTWDETRLRDLVHRMEINRYGGFGGEGSWRNYRDGWLRHVLHIHRGHGLTIGDPDLEHQLVLDYGCGLGLEALQYARAGAWVSVADIVPDNVELATRVLDIMGEGDRLAGRYWIPDDLEELPRGGRFDIVHCAGVLHHIREPRPTMELFAEIADELRLMVYSDIGWNIALAAAGLEGLPTFPGEPAESAENRAQFIRFFDGVGYWADWYDRTRLESEFGDLFRVVECEYITEDRRYLAATLRTR